MGKHLSKYVDTNQIEKEINESPVVLYSRNSCGYCKLAKNLLNEENINFSEHDLDLIKLNNPMSYQDYVNGLVYLTRKTTVPQIFICGKFIGGYTELAKIHEAKKLISQIEVCART